jgi:selenocysteine lyase/cysteine desulfurase
LRRSAPRECAGVVSFLVDGCRAEDVGNALDREGIAVRAGIIARSRSCGALV